jgi:tRNA A-37 threonylcarbamoyl transferase component Bud32
MGTPHMTPSIGPATAPARVKGDPRFGRYRLCFELASGGMGTVYLARSEGPSGFEKLVALKRIHEHLAKDQRFVAMFLDEARLAARIHHPNVCSVIDFGTVDESYYLTMPFIEGESLHRLVRAVSKKDEDSKKSFRYVVARLIADACEGLHAAHELRDEAGELLEVVHRDVSPQNLLVGYDGGVRVLDFGVASARHRLYNTATGEVKGKFAYIAPEQIEGRNVDRRADVWSLGVVLYECVALRRLFGKQNMAETVQAVLNNAIPPLRDAVPDVPLALEEIVFKALARDPERRYATARQMGRDLLAFLAEERRAVGNAEIAELMEATFPTALAETRKLIEAARMDEAIDVLVDEEPPPVVTRVAAEPPKRSIWPIAFAVLLALSIGVGATAWYLDRDPTEPPATAAAPIAPAEPQTSAPIAAAEPEPEEEPPAEPQIAEAAEAPVQAPPEVAADPEPAEQEAEPRGRGTVTIATPGGWALVYRGQRRLGEAPGTFELPSGSQAIGIQPFGRGEIRRQRVRVPAGGTVRVSVPVR